MRILTNLPKRLLLLLRAVLALPKASSTGLDCRMASASVCRRCVHVQGVQGVQGVPGVQAYLPPPRIPHPPCRGCYLRAAAAFGSPRQVVHEVLVGLGLARAALAADHDGLRLLGAAQHLVGALRRAVDVGRRLAEGAGAG